MQSRPAFLTMAAGALVAAACAGSALAQGTYDRRDPRARDGISQPEPARGPQCVPMCAEDSSPCDTPQQKAVDGRCASPTAGNR